MKNIISLLLFCCLTFSMGCSQKPQVKTTAQPVIPATIQTGSTTWKHVAVRTAADQKLLETYLKSNSSIIDSLTGKTVALYEANQTKRFYFLISISGSIEWLYLEFSQGKFQTMDQGIGLPF